MTVNRGAVDASALGALPPESIQVFRDGTPLPDCSVAAEPCVSDRGLVDGGGGDAFVTVRTFVFSTWNVGRLAYGATGFGPPISSTGDTSAKAGSAVPVKFALDGDRGLDIFMPGSPMSVPCGAPADDPGTPVDMNGGGLKNHGGDYQFNWKTDKAWSGSCRELVLTFLDGSQLRARFALK